MNVRLYISIVYKLMLEISLCNLSHLLFSRSRSFLSTKFAIKLEYVLFSLLLTTNERRRFPKKKKKEREKNS